MTRVVVTLSDGSLTGLAERLNGLGLTVECRPLLAFAAPAEWGPVDRALAALQTYAAIVVTSPRAASAFSARARERATRGARPPARVWAAGEASAAALGDDFGPVEVPTGSDGAGAASLLARAMIAAGIGSPVLYPCGEAHREELPDLLTRAGIGVDEVVCYRAVLAADHEICAAAEGADLIVVGSARVAQRLAALCPAEPRPRLLALGSTTAAASRLEGWPPNAVAARPTADQVAALVRSVLSDLGPSPA